MTAIWLFLKGIPLWVWIALALLGAGLLYGSSRYDAGAASVRVQWDAQKAKDKAAAEKLNTEYRARERSEQLAAVAAWKKYDEAITNGKNEAEALRADLLSAKRRVRIEWRNGQCDVSSDNPTDGSGESLAELQAASVGRIAGIGTEADARVNLLIERYTEAVNTCNTTPTR